MALGNGVLEGGVSPAKMVPKKTISPPHEIRYINVILDGRLLALPQRQMSKIYQGFAYERETGAWFLRDIRSVMFWQW